MGEEEEEEEEEEGGSLKNVHEGEEFILKAILIIVVNLTLSKPIHDSPQK